MAFYYYYYYYCRSLLLIKGTKRYADRNNALAYQHTATCNNTLISLSCFCLFTAFPAGERMMNNVSHPLGTMTALWAICGTCATRDTVRYTVRNTHPGTRYGTHPGTVHCTVHSQVHCTVHGQVLRHVDIACLMATSIEQTHTCSLPPTMNKQTASTTSGVRACPPARQQLPNKLVGALEPLTSSIQLIMQVGGCTIK